MDHTAFLAKFTGYPTPGRLAVRTVPIKGKADRQIQAERLVTYMELLHEISCSSIKAGYQFLLDKDDAAKSGAQEWFRSPEEAGKEIFRHIRNACYPYIHVSENSIVKTNSQNQWKETQEGDGEGPGERGYAFDMMLAPVDHYQTITEPRMQSKYLRTSIYRLLGVGYQVEVGLSIVPIPLLFALEHCGIRNSPQGRVAETAQAQFPMPNLAEIEDSFADGTYKRRNASSLPNVEYQLFYSEFWKRYRKYLEYPTNKEGWKNTSDVEELDTFQTFRRAQLEGNLLSKPEFPDRCDGMPPIERVAGPVPKRFGLFDALRTDFSIARLRHYNGMSPSHFQNYVLFTNYAKYVRRFVLRCIAEITTSTAKLSPKLIVSPRKDGQDPDGHQYDRDNIRDVLSEQEIAEIQASVENSRSLDPNGELGKKIEQEFVRCDPQMPAYHFVAAEATAEGVRPRGGVNEDQYLATVFRERPLPGVSLINIGVGPSNARNITDHIAVTRPLCWIMVGHCGGLRQRQKLGDYVIATGYVRRDGVLDEELPLDLPIHGTRSVNEALTEAATYHLASQSPAQQTEDWWPDLASDLDPNSPEVRKPMSGVVQLRSRIRVGTVLSTSNRNWETSPTDEMFELFQRYRAVAVDMESATLAANASRYRVPHGTFLCISDRPLHGIIKMKINSDKFYSDQINKHLDISLDALRLLQDSIDYTLGLMYPRELTGTDDPPWR